MKALFARWREDFRTLLAADAVSPAGQRVVLGALLLAALLVRLNAIGVPALDRTFWKEIDYLAISTSYWQHGYNFLRPEIAWPADEPRLTAMELPLVPWLAAVAYPVLGFTPLSVRLVTLAAFLVLTVYLFVLVRRELGPVIALVAAAAVAALPLHHPFGRLLYSEPFMLAAAVMGLHHFARWLDQRRRRDWFLAITGFSLAVAVKAEPLYLLLPLAFLVWRRHGRDAAAWKSAAAFVAWSLVLPAAWYAWAWHLKTVSMDVFGIFGGHDKLQTVTMLSQPAWYREMFGRVSYGVLGGKIGSALAVAGLATALLVRRGGLFAAYLAAILCYFAIVAEGNLDAPYRQLHILPAAATFVALGSAALAVAAWQVVRPVLRAARSPASFAVAAGLALIVLIPLRRMSDVFPATADEPVDDAKWALAMEIRRHRTPGARLVAAGEYTIHKGGNDLSPVLYHYAGIQGWTLQRGDWSADRVAELAGRGASLFAASNMDREPESEPFLRALRERYPVLYADSARGLLLLDLRPR